MSKSSDFVHVKKVVERVKYLIKHRCDGNVKDIDVAIHLQINYPTMASCKYRNQIRPILPYVLKFCNETGNDPMKILF